MHSTSPIGTTIDTVEYSQAIPSSRPTKRLPGNTRPYQSLFLLGMWSACFTTITIGYLLLRRPTSMLTERLNVIWTFGAEIQCPLNIYNQDCTLFLVVASHVLTRYLKNRTEKKTLWTTLPQMNMSNTELFESTLC